MLYGKTKYVQHHYFSASFYQVFFYSKILKWIICDLHWHTTVLEKFKVILLLNDRFCW